MVGSIPNPSILVIAFVASRRFRPSIDRPNLDSESSQASRTGREAAVILPLALMLRELAQYGMLQRTPTANKDSQTISIGPSHSQIDSTFSDLRLVNASRIHEDFLQQHASLPPLHEDILKNHSRLCTSHLTYVMAAIQWTAVKGTAVSSFVLRVKEAVCQATPR
jgi:hypothetical protein